MAGGGRLIQTNCGKWKVGCRIDRMWTLKMGGRWEGGPKTGG